MRWTALLPAAVVLPTVLACGGGGGGGGGGFGGMPYGDVAFKTYQFRDDQYRFVNDEKVVWKWKNASGDPATGAWHLEGNDTVIIEWEPAKNHTWKTVKLKQINECELAQFYWEFTDGKVEDADSRVFVKQEPMCTLRSR